MAAALLITGSGRLNRDSGARLGRRGPMVLRTGVTRQVAEALGAANVVTLRYDKRGIGASGGDYLRAGLTENLADARAGLRWLAARFPGLPLLTAGHSGFIPMESRMLETRLGPVACQSSGRGPTIVFFAGALANHDLWRDVVAALADRYRCVTVDLPLGAHPAPLAAGADRSAASLAGLLLDSLDLLDVADATVVANDTAGGLLLLSLASGHQALGRVGRLVLTNCESYDQFPPDALKKASALSRAFPWLARTAIRRQLRQQLRRPAVQSKGLSSVTATGLDPGSRRQDVGPGRQSGRGGRPDRRIRARASALTGRKST